MKKVILFFIFIYPFIALSQLNIEITSNLVPLYPSDGDTLSACRDSVILFEAVVKDGADTVTNADYSWDFDDGTILTGIDKDSVTHQFAEGGGYRVKLKVLDASSQEGYKILPLKVAVAPNFSKSKTELPEEQEGICKGSTAKLKGKAFPVEWEEEFIYTVSEEPEIEISDAQTYQSSLSFDAFPLGSTYTPGAIDSIGINLEHSNMGNLKIELTCETGASVLLKDFSTSNDAYLGEPIDDENNFEAGTGYQYYWSNSSTSGIINNAGTSPIAEAAYLPEANFDVLNGCPLNGNWTLNITDNKNTDNGYVFSWSIIFKEDILPQAWTFKDTLLSTVTVNGQFIGTYWTGKNAGITQITQNQDTINGAVSVSPDAYGNNAYTFHVVNNFGCPQDTTIMLRVEEASATASPESGNAKLDVKFENLTTWAVEKEWYFDDKSPAELYIEEDTVTHTYKDKGVYYAVLKVSDEQGCSDRDTMILTISADSKLTNIPNVFTPNGDGVNDVYKFSEESLENMEEFHLTIYNRWGQKMYETKSMEEAIEKGWDGKNRLGGTASPGIYYYVIQAKGKDGKIYKGNRGTKKDKDNASNPNSPDTVVEGTKGIIYLIR